MKAYDFIFVILVYKNTDDILECLKSIKNKVKNAHIIIVNSFYNDDTHDIVKDIALRYNCDFINVENKGYSYGNNRGIEFACNNYIFKYIVVSNPDIIIKTFPKDIDLLKGDIIAPNIIAKNGKKQNPILAYNCILADKVLYMGFKLQIKALIYLGFAINKFIREIFLMINKNRSSAIVYGAHGAFVIFNNKAIKKLSSTPYDEKMFLFEEEFVIAWKAKKEKLKTIYDKSILIHHKEDGSISQSNISELSELGKSCVYFYENYRKQK